PERRAQHCAPRRQRPARSGRYSPGDRTSWGRVTKPGDQRLQRNTERYPWRIRCRARPREGRSSNRTGRSASNHVGLWAIVTRLLRPRRHTDVVSHGLWSTKPRHHGQGREVALYRAVSVPEWSRAGFYARSEQVVVIEPDGAVVSP